MFENDLVELDAAGTLAAAEANEHALATAEVRRLQLAAHWADLHAGEAVPQRRVCGVERPLRVGGQGTPTVAEFAPAELGCVLRMSDGSASRLIADALDLRHRLPLIWATVIGGQAPAYQARHIAKASRHLTAEQAGFVDARIAPSLGSVSFGRLQTLVDAAVIDADPEGAEERATAAAQDRFVRLGRSSEHGLKLIIARATAGDAIWFKAVIDRIADILARQGDTDTVDVRRSKAIGILAQPAEACRLLCEHQTTTGMDPSNQMIWTRSWSQPQPSPMSSRPRPTRIATRLPNLIPALTPLQQVTNHRRRNRDRLRTRATGRSKSCRRRSTQPKRVRGRSSMCISVSRHLPPAPASPGSTTSGRLC